MTARREQIRELLRGARARIDSTEVDLPRRDKRRRGLRREEVAVLAGVSVKWYTWLEQGRDMNFSADVLQRVSAALRLSAQERDYLFALIQRRSVAKRAEEDATAKMLCSSLWFLPVPALVMTLRWDILAWNCLVTRIFRDYSAICPENRNLLRLILTDEKYQDDPENYDRITRKLLAEFRFDFSQCCEDASFEALIQELKITAPGFERHWKDVHVGDAVRTYSVVNHDELGDLYFDRLSYVPKGSTFLRVLMYIPRDPETARVVGSISPRDPPPRFEPHMERLGELDILRHPNRP